MNRLSSEKSPYLLQHAGNPVDWRPWGEEAFAAARARGQTCLPLRRLRHVPLVSRHGARVVRGPGRCRGAERALHLHQGGPRRAAGRGPGLHGVRAADDRQRRMADERVDDARREAVLRRHVLSAGRTMGQARVPRPAARDGAAVARGARPRGACGRERRGSAGRHGRGRARSRCAGHECAGWRDAGIHVQLRLAEWRIWRSAQVPTAIRTAVPVGGAPSDRRPETAGCGRAHPGGHGGGRDARPDWRRLSPLLGGRALAGSPFREDAVRPGAAGAGVSGGRAGDGGPRLHRRRRGHAALCRARHDE